jgi:hypothetical protein
VSLKRGGWQSQVPPDEDALIVAYQPSIGCNGHVIHPSMSNDYNDFNTNCRFGTKVPLCLMEFMIKYRTGKTNEWAIHD